MAKKFEHDTRYEDYLEHYGTLGMKWGVRNEETRKRYASAAKGSIKKVGKAVGDYGKAFGKVAVRSYSKPFKTNTAIRDQNRELIEDRKFGTIIRKATVGFSTSELNDINSRVDKMVSRQATAKYKKFAKSIDKDIASFEPHLKTGVKDKKGKEMFSPKEVQEMHGALVELKQKKLTALKSKIG